MSISYFSLLLLLSAPWMGNGMPEESVEPVSRDSWQVMLLIGEVPWQQPTDFYNDYAIKHSPLDALIIATEGASENPSLAPYHKAVSQPNKMYPLNLDPNASDDELFERVSHLLPYSKEDLKEMQSQLKIEKFVDIIVRALFREIITLVIVPYVINPIIGILGG